MLSRAIRLTEDLAVLSLLSASALAMHLTAARTRRRRPAGSGVSLLY